MYTLPVSDTCAIAIDTQSGADWHVHILNFADGSDEKFSVMGEADPIVSAKYDPAKRQIWLVIGTDVFVIIVDQKEMYEAEMPTKDLMAYDLVQNGWDWLICGAYSTLWKCSPPDAHWTPVMQPDPAPGRADDKAEQTRRVTDYFERYPPLYSAFMVGQDAYFCGALGLLVRYRNGKIDTMRLDTGSRLVSGHAEGSQIVLSSDNPTAEIFVGNFDDGFERIFEDGNRAMHRTALHKGKRYIGVAEYPPTKAHNLYTLEDGELIPQMTGCKFEPSPLISLISTGGVLWAIDAHDIYRLAGDKWSLFQGDEIRAGTWADQL